jgi:hypothetical protein
MIGRNAIHLCLNLFDLASIFRNHSSAIVNPGFAARIAREERPC